MFRPQVGHHQANTERITGPIKCALNGIPFRSEKAIKCTSCRVKINNKIQLIG